MHSVPFSEFRSRREILKQISHANRKTKRDKERNTKKYTGGRQYRMKSFQIC